MNEPQEPKLDAPGAGLPKSELFVAKLLFAWRRFKGNRETFNAHFNQERHAIQKLVRACDEESASRRVLIERVRGLEDSSRYWSVWMTLDHLRIMNSRLGKVITSLAKGVIPPGKASTANVKPNKEVASSVVAEYETTCDQLLAAVADVQNLKTRARFTHPWFGPLDAFGWHVMSAGHMTIHRVQIERILTGLHAMQK